MAASEYRDMRDILQNNEVQLHTILCNVDKQSQFGSIDHLIKFFAKR